MYGTDSSAALRTNSCSRLESFSYRRCDISTASGEYECSDCDQYRATSKWRLVWNVVQLFSAPSMSFVCRAEKISPYDNGVGLAPRARTRPTNMSDGGTLIFRPFKSPGSLTARRWL